MTDSQRNGGAAQDARIADNPQAQRVEVSVAGVVVGFLEYEDRPDGVRVMPSTVVQEEFGGRGLAGRLAHWALTDARERGLRVDPVCPYISAYIGKHPEFKDLLAG